MRRLHGAAPLAAGLIGLFAAFPLLAQSSPEAGAKIYVEKCSVCHTVGGGELAGPDLVNSAKLSDADLRAALHRMEDNVGTLHVDEIESLVGLLKDPKIAALVATAQNPPPAKVVEVERGNAKNGRAYFYGDAHLVNGGPPCFACHTVAGRGGSLAADLTVVHKRLDRTALVTTTMKPAFPLMRGSYTNHAVTEQEAQDLGAFLKESAANAKAGAQPKENAGMVHRVAAGSAVLVLVAVGLISTRRRAGVRSRMVRDRESGGSE